MKVGEIGRQIIVTVRDSNNAVVDVTAATGISIFMRAQLGAVKTFAGVVHNGPAGQFRYTTTSASDVDEPGHWEYEFRYTLGAFTGRTTASSFYALENLA